jgi:tetratricopeptide (TPR) repeat protein
MFLPADKFLTELGARVEARRRAQGVYPRNEALMPTPEDHSACMAEYFADAQRRMQAGQLRPGEDVRMGADGRLQVSGQVSVMAINGLLTKVIFDKNPTNEFYVEESFPLEWMYPHLEPYGIIMRINRQPLAEMSEEKLRRDHEFWSRFSERLIGNWITYDTPVKEICDFVVRVHERRDYTGFKGDPKFIRDDQAQKAFSKLRSSIGGIYTWRLANARTAAEQQRLTKEADFALRQAFAFCPYSPEAVYRYSSLLVGAQRVDDALLIAETCLRFDRENASIQNLVGHLQSLKLSPATASSPQVQQIQQRLAQLELRLQTNPTDPQAVFDLASVYLQLQRSNSALELLDRLIELPAVDVNTLLSVANAYAQLQQGSRLENALLKLVRLTPESPEAWYDLASTRSIIGKAKESIEALTRAMELSDARRAQNSAARDLRADVQTNQSFQPVRNLPEFQQAVSRGPAE